MLLVPVYLIFLFPLIVVSFSPSVFLFRCVLHPLPLSSCLGCIPPLIGLPSLRFYAVGSSLFLLSVCFLFMFSILSRRCPLLATSLSVLFCLLSMLISDSRFDLVWFRLSCDHGWIRSGSVNVRKQKQNNNNERIEHERKTELCGVLLLCITVVRQSLHNPLTAYHTVADEEARAGDIVQKTRILSDPLALPGAPRSSLSLSCSLHDAPRQPIVPSFQ